ncbi:hypothetical protein Hanom_Chr06g00513151 [Helianthus anomalus]
MKTSNTLLLDTSGPDLSDFTNPAAEAVTATPVSYLVTLTAFVHLIRTWM